MVSFLLLKIQIFDPHFLGHEEERGMIKKGAFNKCISKRGT